VAHPFNGERRLTRLGRRDTLRVKQVLNAKIPVVSCTILLAGYDAATAREGKVKHHVLREHSGRELPDGLFSGRF
jgi:hypothetical protein